MGGEVWVEVWVEKGRGVGGEGVEVWVEKG